MCLPHFPIIPFFKHSINIKREISQASSADQLFGPPLTPRHQRFCWKQFISNIVAQLQAKSIPYPEGNKSLSSQLPFCLSQTDPHKDAFMGSMIRARQGSPYFYCIRESILNGKNSKPFFVYQMGEKSMSRAHGPAEGLLTAFQCISDNSLVGTKANSRKWKFIIVTNHHSQTSSKLQDEATQQDG